MNDGCYAEGIVRRRMSVGSIVAMIGMIVLVTAGLLLTLVNRWGVILLVLSAILVFIFYKYLRVEYEYIFVTGEFQVDKIYSGSVRKKGPRIDMSSVERVERANEERIRDARASGNVRVQDFTSHEKDADSYMIVYRGNTGQCILLFEPNEKLLKTMWRNAPSKVVLPQL